MQKHSTEARTKAGVARGVQIGKAIVWRGIPYAAAPIGNRRFKPPVDVPAWDGVWEASHWGSKAMQVINPRSFALTKPDTTTSTFGGTPGVSEDCLFVNVTAPVETPTGGAPVMVWIHGGGFVTGSGADAIGDGLKFASGDGIVFVSFNYRLGALGFLNLAPLLGEEFKYSGNVGLLDQIAALRWVNKNIAAFGGDPNNVTIMGVSAGAKSVVTLMAAPAARGLFNRAISQSGGGDRAASSDVTAATAQELIALLNLASPVEILHVSGTELVKAAKSIGGLGPMRDSWIWLPTVDGDVLPSLPIEAINAGKAAGISLLVGNTSNEAGLYATFDPDVTTHAKPLLRKFHGDSTAAKIISSYEAWRPGATSAEIDREIMTDERYGVATLRLADAQSAFAPTYRYYFTAGVPGLPPSTTAGHGMDIPYVFGLIPETDSATDELVRIMGEYWASFISTGKPRAAKAPEWPEYTCPPRPTMIFGPFAEVADDPTADRHKTWDDVSIETSRWYQRDGLK
jgi:para-nitrobenzyl esterase